MVGTIVVGNNLHRIFFQIPMGLSLAKVQATVCGVTTAKKTVTYNDSPLRKVFIQTDKPIYKPGQKGILESLLIHFQPRQC